jgi:hypothetical protein
MQAFEEAYAAEGTGTLYWCGIAEEATSDVDRLLHVAKDAGRQAYYIPILGFDDLMTRLGLFASDGPQRDAIKSLVASVNGADSHSTEAFTIPRFNAATVIKSNAFEVECPAEVFAFDLKEWPEDHVWQYLRNLAADSKFVAAPFKGRVLSIGLLDSIKDKFGNNINGSIQRVPITTHDFRYEDGAVTRIMREAVVRSLVEKSGVNSDGHSELWLTKPTQTVVANGVEYEVFESVLIFLRRLGDAQFLLLKPSVRVLDKAGIAAPDEVAGNVKLVILGGQYNPKFNAAINTWRNVLIDDLSNPAIIEYPYDSGSSFRFRIRKAPIFAEIGARYRRSAVNLSRVPTQLLRHKGFELDEPSLVFARRDGKGTATDTHPMRGILDNRPFDFPLTRRQLANEVRVGVVCPKAESKLLEDFLQKAHQRQRVRSNAEYLLDYPGFQQAYGLPLNLPTCGDRSWVTCNEPTGNDAHATARDLARNITVAIENLRAASAISVVLILVPDRWQLFEGYTTEDERFDLHDFVKAYCVQKGITSQFLRQTTLAKSDLCQLWWWLSLALYVKAMRTPWVLESLEQETAFVGLGFSISPIAERGRHVILGCSHVYSERGEGLQYRLSKIENPVFRGSNPFMSRDDARRVGETTRQLFFDSRLRLPDRVVFHKRTPFLREEREGLLEGLSGVQHVEMLEIQVDSALRYVASIIKGNTIDEDNFPVKRGTAVKLDDFSALVWVHGVTTAVNPRKKYFQGKRRIPAPVHIRRHLGNSDLSLVAEEILALSKMNWNTFNLYTKVPATIQSSNEIARIGALLERFGAESYDYRLFI